MHYYALLLTSNCLNWIHDSLKFIMYKCFKPHNLWAKNSIKITNYRTNEITDNWGCVGICDSGICHWFTLLLQVSFNQKNHHIDLGSWTCRHLIFSLEYEVSSRTRPSRLSGRYKVFLSYLSPSLGILELR